ncbi:glycosyltransferase family 1 protein [Sphingobacterium sp. UDSM-2020]|uniref:glycosyltransferase family 1 protein n=1 Tax=Sphingobacterium sp. UDSM-2020 TaxID=2795738 RepID=UPI001935D12A|nr:glycosyltransferase family 1 protein [Sphingobacterium sp. UDSM-2020]QQD15380.1 glycosyltransferase family 1 protein [Sphingobacterium sp. UDSM-2020]
MKRILQVVGTMHRGGAETMVMNFYRAIDKSKFNFDFVYFTDEKCDYDEEILSLGGKIYRILDKNPVKRIIALTTLIKKNPQWDTVHAHTLFSIGFHLLAAKRAGIKKRIAHAHSTNDAANQSLVGKIYQYIALKFINKYTTIPLACGAAAAKYLYPYVSNTTIIANSIDVHRFADIAEQNGDYLRKEFNLKPETLILLQLGRLNGIKNPFFSLAIATDLKKRNINFRLFFVGKGEAREELIRKIGEHGLAEECYCLGLRTDVAALLAGSDLMLMPSLYEGFPMVLVEAQASGTPALISDGISPEVDLGIGLIDFQSLKNSPAHWASEALEIVKRKKSNAVERVRILEHLGFDVLSNVKRLEELYKK